MNGRYSWTTDLSSSLKIGQIIWIILMTITVVGIPIAILMYLFWSKIMNPTLISDGTKLMIYEEYGRKANTHITKYYYNPSLVNTIHAKNLQSRSRILLVLFVFSLVMMIGALVDRVTPSAFLVPVIFGLLFFLINKRISVIIINPEVLESYSDKGYHQSILSSITETRLKSTGNIELGGNAAIVFGGIDHAAEQAFQDMWTNFDLYTK